ncbi:MAG: pyridoxamine 5'-phosphate oxidase family protein [Methanophagales archaeon ANME-1-THS]|nr:MAG: pyridoxamine 5'-phosphate oxidase family protein [Methanophagales archaeon ANME-1-THS]
MGLVKIPAMEKEEYDRLIAEGYISRIAFSGRKYPYIAPFLYVFDGQSMYFLSTKYGTKIQYFRQNPYVSVEVEKYTPDLSTYTFVTLSGRLVEVEDPAERKAIREKFIHLIEHNQLSKNVMAALGHSPEEPLESLVKGERSFVWKLVDVTNIVALKNG